MDGDQLFIVKEKKGKPIFMEVDLTRIPGEIKDKDIETLFSKAKRTDRTDINSWLPTYFDDVPIGPATYAIRWELYKKTLELKGKVSNPIQEAWKEVAPMGIQMIEFVMDIRKNDWTDTQITNKLAEISAKNKEIKMAAAAGDWFARTVTASSIDDIQEFIRSFETLQEYINHITGQPNSLAKELKMETGEHVSR